MGRNGRRIEGLTAWDVALVQRIRRGGSASPEEWRRFASGVEDLDAWRPDDDEDEFDDALPPLRCDGSVCCPCGRCGALERTRGTDTPSRGDEQHRRPSAPPRAEAVGPER